MGICTYIENNADLLLFNYGRQTSSRYALCKYLFTYPRSHSRVAQHTKLYISSLYEYRLQIPAKPRASEGNDEVTLPR